MLQKEHQRLQLQNGILELEDARARELKRFAVIEEMQRQVWL